MNDRSRHRRFPRRRRPPNAEHPAGPRVVGAIPCYNEERFIGSVVLKTRGLVDEIIVIDDGSTDETAKVAEQAGARVIRHDYNLGKAAAVTTAFQRAKETGCQVLVLLDGDGQHDPSDIPKLVQPVLDGRSDIVVGSRFLGVDSHVPGYRVWGQRVLTFLTNLGSSVSVTDSQSGFRAFSRRAVETLSFAEKGLSVESEMQFLAKESDLRVEEVSTHIGYLDSPKRNPVAHGMSVFNSIIGLISRRLPLIFFGVPGVIMMGFGLWQAWTVVQGYNSTGEFYIGPALMAMVLCIIGSLSIFTGLILYTIRSFFK